MTKPAQLHSALIALIALVLAAGAASAWADGTLTHLSGSVSVVAADGKTLVGAVGAKVNAGDTLVTGAGGYVRLQMTDGSEIVLRPSSQFKVESYNFSDANPANDGFVFRMLKGGLRTVTGLIGKRGNRDAYAGKTPTATIGIRGTAYDLRVCEGNCGALADGTYVAVRFGEIETTNVEGRLSVAAGQSAYVPLLRPPVMLPRDPGIGFTPPAAVPKPNEKKKSPGTLQVGAGSNQGTTPTGTSGSSSKAPTKDGVQPDTAGTAAIQPGGTSSPATMTTQPAPGSDCVVQ